MLREFEIAEEIPQGASKYGTISILPAPPQLIPPMAETPAKFAAQSTVSSPESLIPPMAEEPAIEDAVPTGKTQAPTIPSSWAETPAIEDAQTKSIPPESPIIAEITQLWRMRQRWHRAEKSLVLQGKAVCRAWTDGEKESASKLFDAARAAANVPATPIRMPPPPDLMTALAPFISAIEQFEPQRAIIEKRLRKLSRSLPVWGWVAAQKGFGDLNLAAIVGEAGDIGSYKSVSALWKRMGLAVIDGGRQRRVAGDDALLHGYSPQRRCVAYLLGDCLVKGNGEGEFRTLYLARKEIDAANPEVKTKAHAHNRAARYMTKRALMRLYIAWRAQ